MEFDDLGSDDGPIRKDPVAPDDSMCANLTALLRTVKEERVSCASVGGRAAMLPSAPGLTVAGERIALPLSEGSSGLKHVLQHARASAHGRGMETVVDAAVRSSMEVDAEHVSFAHPEWENSLQALAQAVAGDLKCNAQQVKAVPYKLLVYRQGDHFKTHRDTEKEEGMFATLIVQLPSRCSGGDLKVMHFGEEKAYDFGAADGEFYCHYAAHYADVQHAIEEVRNGVRLAMVYNLVWNGSAPSSPDDHSKEVAALFKEWDSFAQPAVVTLEHIYTPQSTNQFGLEALKGSDAVIASCIMNAAASMEEQHRVRVYFGEVTRTTTKYQYGYTPRTPSPRFKTLKRFAPQSLSPDDAAEKRLHSHVQGISMTQFVHTIEPAMFWSNGSSSSEYTGNEGMSLTTLYKRCALVVLPERYSEIIAEQGLWFKVGVAIASVNRNVYQEWRAGEISPETRKLGHEALRHIFKHHAHKNATVNLHMRLLARKEPEFLWECLTNISDGKAMFDLLRALLDNDHTVFGGTGECEGDDEIEIRATRQRAPQFFEPKRWGPLLQSAFFTAANNRPIRAVMELFECVNAAKPHSSIISFIMMGIAEASWSLGPNCSSNVSFFATVIASLESRYGWKAVRGIACSCAEESVFVCTWLLEEFRLQQSAIQDQARVAQLKKVRDDISKAIPEACRSCKPSSFCNLGKDGMQILLENAKGKARRVVCETCTNNLRTAAVLAKLLHNALCHGKKKNKAYHRPIDTATLMEEGVAKRVYKESAPMLCSLLPNDLPACGNAKCVRDQLIDLADAMGDQRTKKRLLATESAVEVGLKRAAPSTKKPQPKRRRVSE